MVVVLFKTWDLGKHHSPDRTLQSGAFECQDGRQYAAKNWMVARGEVAGYGGVCWGCLPGGGSMGAGDGSRTPSSLFEMVDQKGHRILMGLMSTRVFEDVFDTVFLQ